MDSSLIKDLQRILGRENLAWGETERLCYGYDATVAADIVLPEAVAFPQTADQVAQILRLANRVPFFVIPRGAGSGLTGGARPVCGGLVLSTERMNRILAIDSECLQAVVEPGVVTEKLQLEVEKLGLFYAPDPQSRAVCTIGGNLAENAGGPRAVKYGVTRTHVLAAEAVLPQGELVRLGARTVKSVAGYDLLSLLIGSEGTLGVFTQATLRLLPLPRSRRTILAAFYSLEDCTRAVAAVLQAGVLPSALEFMDRAAVNCVEDYQPSGLPREAEAVLLVEVDGSEAQTAEDAALAKAVLEKHGARNLQQADDARSSEALWKARRAAGPALARIAPIKFNEDIVVPINRLPEAVLGIHRIAEKYATRCAIFGHAGDGNLHVNFLSPADNAQKLADVERAVDEMFDLVISLEGSITGEHGVGTTKAKYLPREIGLPVLELMRRIKQTLDPLGILNPGKIFPVAQGD